MSTSANLHLVREELPYPLPSGIKYSGAWCQHCHQWVYVLHIDSPAINPPMGLIKRIQAVLPFTTNVCRCYGGYYTIECPVHGKGL